MMVEMDDTDSETNGEACDLAAGALDDSWGTPDAHLRPARTCAVAATLCDSTAAHLGALRCGCVRRPLTVEHPP